MRGVLPGLCRELPGKFRLGNFLPKSKLPNIYRELTGNLPGLCRNFTGKRWVIFSGTPSVKQREPFSAFSTGSGLLQIGNARYFRGVKLET